MSEEKQEKGILPEYQAVYSDKDMVVKKNKLNAFLNRNPNPDWIKKRGVGNNKKIDYLPIERVEWLLTTIYGDWRCEIIDYKIIANSVAVTIRLHYTNPITGISEFMDGLGASPLQTNKGAAATDWTQIKSNAVQLALPAAESFAIKDAADKLGKLFGKDLNRQEIISYMNLVPKNEAEFIDIRNQVSEAINLIQDLEIQNKYAKKAAKAYDGNDLKTLKTILDELTGK